MEFLVEFDVHVPDGAARWEVEERESNEAAAAAKLAAEGHLVRIWKRPAAAGHTGTVGVYRADSRTQLDGLLRALPLADWMRVTVTPLEPHPNDPATRRPSRFRLPRPQLTPVYRLDATVGDPLDVGDTGRGRRRIVPLTGGTFTGPQISGTLVAGTGADWQTVLPGGTAFGDVRYTLRTDDGDLLSVQSRAVRHGRGEDVDPSEYTLRAATQIEAAAPALDWLNNGVFIGVAARQAAGVVYETYLVR